MTPCRKCGTTQKPPNGALCGRCADDFAASRRRQDGDGPTAVRAVTLTPASAIRTERIKWFWDGRIPRRSVVVIAGEKGLGKSTLTNAYLPARLTRGELTGEFLAEPVDVAIATAEDDWRSVVRPRLEAHGADLDRVHQVNVTDVDGVSLFTLPDDVERLEKAIKELEVTTGRKVGLLVLDPITAFLSGSIDSHKDAAVRRAIAPLAAFADRADLAVLIVAHLTKDDSARLLNRVTGSGAFVNAARGVLAWARDPDDPDGDQGYRRVLVPVATNWGKLAPTLAAHIDSVQVSSDDGPIDVPALTFHGECDVTASDLQRGELDTTGVSGSDAVALALTSDWRPALEIKNEVSAALGVTHRAVEKYARQLEADGVLERTKTGFPAIARWRLTAAETGAVANDIDAPGFATAQQPANTGDSGGGEISREQPSRLRAYDTVRLLRDPARDRLKLGITDDPAARMQRLERFDQLGRQEFAGRLGVDETAIEDTPVEELLEAAGA